MFGMWGYFVSFFLSHAVNALLSFGLLLKTAGIRVRPQVILLTALVMIGALTVAKWLPGEGLQVGGFILLAMIGLLVLEVVRKEDGIWLVGLIKTKKTRKK